MRGLKSVSMSNTHRLQQYGKRRNKPYILDNLAEVGMWKKSDMEIFYTQTSIQPLSPLALGLTNENLGCKLLARQK